MLVSGYSSSRIRCIQIADFAFRTCFGNFCGHDGKYDRQRRQKYKREKQANKTRQNISLFRKVTLSQRPAPIELLVLLGSPSCRPLPLLRKTHELLANGGLLCSVVVVVVHSDCWLNSVVIYPDV